MSQKIYIFANKTTTIYFIIKNQTIMKKFYTLLVTALITINGLSQNLNWPGSFQSFDIIPNNTHSIKELCPYDIYAKLQYNTATFHAITGYNDSDVLKIDIMSQGQYAGLVIDLQDLDFYSIFYDYSQTSNRHQKTFYVNASLEEHRWTQYAIILVPLNSDISNISMNVEGLWYDGNDSSGQPIYSKDPSVNFNLNGILKSNVFTVTIPKNIDYNIFTCNANTDMKLLAFYDGHFHFCDNYKGTGDVNWAADARIKIPKSYSDETRKVQFIAFGSNLTNSIADIFVAQGPEVSDTIILNRFPNYKADDVIVTAPSNTDYNCYGFAEGVFCNNPSPYSSFSWVANLVSSNYNSDFWEYYGYTSSGATEENSVLDIWQYNWQFTHASVKHGTKYAIGYGWESKFGQGKRFMHPRYALESDDVPAMYYPYGHVQLHYIENPYFVAQNVQVENVEFSDTELSKINHICTLILDEDRDEFEKRYESVKEIVWKYGISNLNLLNIENDYQKLIALCKKSPEVLGLVYKKLINADDLAMQLLSDVTLKENKNLMVKMWQYHPRKELEKLSPTQIYRSDVSNATLYAKMLLEKTYGQSGDLANGFSYSDDDNVFYATTNENELTVNFFLKNEAKVSILLSEAGSIKSVKAILNEKTLTTGNHTVKYIVPKHGIYVISYNINDRIYTKKITI